VCKVRKLAKSCPASRMPSPSFFSKASAKMPYTSRSPDQASAFVLAALTFGRDSGSHFNCARIECGHEQSDGLRL